jgi:hypothetical protein
MMVLKVKELSTAKKIFKNFSSTKYLQNANIGNVYTLS